MSLNDDVSEIRSRVGTDLAEDVFDFAHACEMLFDGLHRKVGSSDIRARPEIQVYEDLSLIERRDELGLDSL